MRQSAPQKRGRGRPGGRRNFGNALNRTYDSSGPDVKVRGTAMTIFENSGMEYFIAQSFAKNFGLYGERIGYIHVKCNSKEATSAVLSQLKILIRQAYSSPPRHGAAIVYKLLTNPALKAQWLGELGFMSKRILDMRSALRAALEAKGTPGTWNHITDQIGMFSSEMAMTELHLDS